MINLLPTETKEAYRYARRNRVLVHWITVGVFCLVGGMLLTAGGYLYLNQSIDNLNQQISSSNKQLQSENLGSVQGQITDISNNLKLAVQVLSKEILFSKLLERLAAVTPSNAILTNLSITQAEGGVEITAQTTNYSAASQLQVNLADPSNQIFSQADIESISCNTSGGGGSNSGSGSLLANYPCMVDIRALFATNNPFLFINTGKKSS